jgi:hypothetical protein
VYTWKTRRQDWLASPSGRLHLVESHDTHSIGLCTIFWRECSAVWGQLMLKCETKSNSPGFHSLLSDRVKDRGANNSLPVPRIGSVGLYRYSIGTQTWFRLHCTLYRWYYYYYYYYYYYSMALQFLKNLGRLTYFSPICPVHCLFSPEFNFHLPQIIFYVIQPPLSWVSSPSPTPRNAL